MSRNKLDILYLNPPWPERGGGKIKRGADKHYNLMSVKEIIALPIGAYAKKNSHIYLWVTNNYLAAGLKAIDAWGFDYKSTVTWVKDKMGIGQYFRGQTEHCLFGVKGMIPYKSENGKRCQHVTFFQEPRTNHSEKPEKMREIINHVSFREGFQRGEFFARREVEGWDCYGDEIGKPID